ncbi:hypothetical protein CQW23_02475 [Capsicum baccatum]|uniref:CCHC-type domain-containing protein n=1 Tax=Capsicum baccatum TaxID=33114 RepID=A0A2G2XRK6_CAPBA|nr:hypothetical protein CQW23_02475 [Capsicum baccatum]
MLSYIDIYVEFIEKFGFKAVKQLLVTGPTGRYFMLKDDSRIRTLQSIFSYDFGVIQLFAVDEGETPVIAPNISLINEPTVNTIDIGIGTDCESSEEEENNEPIPSDYSSEELKVFRKENREINDRLDRFLELDKGMCFKNLKEAKRIVSFYCIARKVGLKVDKSDKTRLKYVCDVGFPFECLISEDKDQGFKIKTLNVEHTCWPALKNRRATQDALAHYFKKIIQNNPKYKVSWQDIDDNFSLNVSLSKMKRVKRLVLEKLEGSYIDEFNKLEGYAQELRDSNHDGEGVTFMSNMQKGLLDAVAQVFPTAHHRWCVRHIEANWSKIWKTVEMKRLLWWSAWSTYEEEFHDQLKNMGSVSEQAVEDLLWYPAQRWCRAYFDTICKNQGCDNNFTESFNKWILKARAQPIMKMLENIRIKVMNRLKELDEEGRKWKENFSPYALELYNDYLIIAQSCHIQSNEDQGIPCPHAIKAYLHDKQEPKDRLHSCYLKETYNLVYMHKIQPVRGEKFWKIDPSHAMEPPEIVKMVGRSKLKRKREKAEARKREGVWSASRKGVKMTCGHCGDTGHNQRKCPLLQRTAQTAQDVVVAAPLASQESISVFMPTPDFICSSSQQKSLFAGVSNSKTNVNQPITSLSVVSDEDDDESEEEDQTILSLRQYLKKRLSFKQKKCAAVIDVGTNTVDDPSRKSGYRLVGDVDFQEVSNVAGWITPVPGGVGPMMVTMLLKNTLDGAKRVIDK